MKNVFIFDHPLINHKIAILRDKNTGMKEFRELIEEITIIMTYESMRDVELIPVDVETPLEVTRQYRVPERQGRAHRHVPRRDDARTASILL